MGTAGLGLFALLLQLFVSFGHLHARDLTAPRAWAAASADTAAAVGKSAAPGQEQIPTGFPDDDCPICMTMHIAASGLLPALLSIAAPAELAQVLHQTFIEEFSLGATRHILFQTRAPPTA